MPPYQTSLSRPAKHVIRLLGGHFPVSVQSFAETSFICFRVCPSVCPLQARPRNQHECSFFAKVSCCALLWRPDPLTPRSLTSTILLSQSSVTITTSIIIECLYQPRKHARTGQQSQRRKDISAGNGFRLHVHAHINSPSAASNKEALQHSKDAPAGLRQDAS